MPTGLQKQAPPRIQVEDPQPLLDCGRYPAKRTVGDTVDVSATLFRDGHTVLRAVVRYRGPGQTGWTEAPMRRVDAHAGGDSWAGAFEVTGIGRWQWTIEAWTDTFAAWRHELGRKIAFGQQDLAGELSEGAVLLLEAAARAPAGPDRTLIEHTAAALRDPDTPAEAKNDAALGPELFAAVLRHPDRHDATTMPRPVEVDVDRERARFGSWYELFPRSWGGFAGVEREVPRLAELGFDVLYLPPIHPIGHTHRKGRNNALTAVPGDPGSPWAIGDEHGGHAAIHPDLGSLEDFDLLVATAGEHGLEIALDLAINCSADHPWLTEHPEWFHRRPDGTLKYAENPPKKYHDIYNVNWDCEDWQGLWNAVLEVVRHWVAHGVKVFRVDNPHTKPLPFWEWLIRNIRATDPDVIFLAEAFTRAAMMRTLAKLGFAQSYTYFTWKNSRWELMEYVSELAHSGMQEYYRPNFFTNTQDILTEYLVRGGPRAFEIRFLLASTLSPTYGIYSGFEHYENVPVREGSEEYLNSEKYEIKQRALDGPMLPLIARVNAIRRENPALQRLENIQLLETRNDALIAYVKREAGNVIVVVVTIDFDHAQEGVAMIPWELGLPPTFEVSDLLTGERFGWHTGENYVRLDPHHRVAHLLRVDHP